DWLAQTTAPDLAEPSPAAPAGSWLLRQNSAIHEMYLKTASTATAGWTRQNYDTRVYNLVIDFGGNGDGVTDNRAAINTAISTIDAAGGGILYFPPGQYAVLKPNAGVSDLCPLSNKHNITFLGDGKASQIRVSGNQFAVTT